jgi:hypothetical protein
MPLSLRWRSFLVPKDGHAEAECEDAVAGDPTIGRFAIADGASESYASGDWARLLVDAFIEHGPSEDWLNAPQTAWKEQAVGSAVSWYAEEKFTRGGHATFLGLSIQIDDDAATWEAIAVGDACLFVMSHAALLTSFPLNRSSEFSSTPVLVGSRGASPDWKRDRGTLQAGDVILIATDAVAQCLLESAESRTFIGPDLRGMEHEDDFALWVAASRAAGRLRNDDVALGVIEVRG